MNLVGMISTVVLSLTLVAAAPVFAQEQHDSRKSRKLNAAQEEKKAQPEKSAKPDEKPRRSRRKIPSRKGTKRKNKQRRRRSRPKIMHSSPSALAIVAGPDSRRHFRANFGQQHTFRVTQADYSNHRFQYGGYSFGFADPWPSNWLYTQNVYVVDIDGMYYLCNARFRVLTLHSASHRRGRSVGHRDEFTTRS